MKGKYDAYMFGLGGPKSENVEKPLVLRLLFEGSKAARARQENEQRSSPDCFLVEKVGKKEQKGNK